MKFVQPLEPHTRDVLRELSRNNPSPRVRQRAHTVLLSHKGYRIKTIADIFEVNRDTVSCWLDAWDRQRFEGLHDAPRPGRPPKHTSATSRPSFRFAPTHFPPVFPEWARWIWQVPIAGLLLWISNNFRAKPEPCFSPVLLDQKVP